MIPVSQLRDPAHAARTGFDEEALDELCCSIRDQGMHTPLQVRALGDGTFEVIAGHRRLLAARRLGLIEVPTIVRADSEAVHALRISENVDREDLRPTDEARYYKDLYDELGKDVDRVCAVVRRSRARVEGRLLLIAGSEAVWGALDKGEITIGVAEELNRFTVNGDREFHLRYAILQGATVAQVRDWRTRCNAAAAAGSPGAAPSDSVAAPGPGAPAADPGPVDPLVFRLPHEVSSSLEPRPCMFCKERFPEWQTFRQFVCPGCYQTHVAPFDQRERGA
jgi:ParB family chromosome partitioning protein